MSALEDQLGWQMSACGITSGWYTEYRFHSVRKFRLDFANPDKMLAVEVEGGTWVNGRHSRGAGMKSDMEKYNLALLSGWRVLRVNGDHIKSGQAIKWIEEALK